MAELHHAIVIAHRILHRVGANPEDDLAVLATHFLRARDALVYEKDKSSSLIGRYLRRRRDFVSNLLRFFVLVAFVSSSALADPISGFMCTDEGAAESMLIANAKTIETMDRSAEDALANKLISSGVCVRVQMEFEAVEVYRGKIIRVNGVAKQVVGFAPMGGREPGLFGMMNVEERAL